MSARWQAAAGGPELVVRLATGRDRAALERLAQLDSATPPAGDHLLAEEDGELRAAVSLVDGTAIADPFHPSADLVAILRIRATRYAAAARAAERRREPAIRARRRSRPRPMRTAPPAAPAGAR